MPGGNLEKLQCKSICANSHIHKNYPIWASMYSSKWWNGLKFMTQ